MLAPRVLNLTWKSRRHCWKLAPEESLTSRNKSNRSPGLGTGQANNPVSWTGYLPETV